MIRKPPRSITLRSVILACALIVAPLAKSEAGLVCDRQKIRQAIAEVRQSPQIEALKKMPIKKPSFASTQRLISIFRNLEMKTFRQHILQIEDFPAWPGLTRHDNVIQFSSRTDKTLQQRLTDPDLGAAFEIAHEFGHIVQDTYLENNPDKLSPHGLRHVTAAQDSEEFNIFHSETDCIATEILYEAGYPLTETIPNTLALIKEECLAEQPAAFCEQADAIRETAVRNFIATFPALQPPSQPASQLKTP